ncbi:hypothetical protein TraAM80_10039, partial [Trypanosoma rangeli]
EGNPARVMPCPAPGEGRVHGIGVWHWGASPVSHPALRYAQYKACTPTAGIPISSLPEDALLEAKLHLVTERVVAIRGLVPSPPGTRRRSQRPPSWRCSLRLPAARAAWPLSCLTGRRSRSGAQ